MIEEQFVSRDTARMLKEAGFREHCRCMYFPEKGGYHKIFQNIISDYDVTNDDKYETGDYYGYGDCYLAPTQALAARWLREVHGMYIEIHHRVTGYGYYITKIETNELLAIPTIGDETQFDIYEEAFENALRKAIKLIKK